MLLRPLPIPAGVVEVAISAASAHCSPQKPKGSLSPPLPAPGHLPIILSQGEAPGLTIFNNPSPALLLHLIL